MNIFIAGASGGIGRYLTEKFDKEGNMLYLTYNTSIDGIYIPKNAKYVIIKVDFTKEFQVDRVFKRVEPLSVLINVMGIVDNGLIYKMIEEQWNKVIDSNLKSVFLSCKYGINQLFRGGHIINFSSVLGSTGMIGASNYVTAKGGVEAFTKSFALECVRDKKFVNAIALGYFKVGMGLQLSEKIESLVKGNIPLKEFGDPEEIFKLVEYIISSKYLVGQIIHLNGGLRI